MCILPKLKKKEGKKERKRERKEKRRAFSLRERGPRKYSGFLFYR